MTMTQTEEERILQRAHDALDTLAFFNQGERPTVEVSNGDLSIHFAEARVFGTLFAEDAPLYVWDEQGEKEWASPMDYLFHLVPDEDREDEVIALEALIVERWAEVEAWLYHQAEAAGAALNEDNDDGWGNETPTGGE